MFSFSAALAFIALTQVSQCQYPPLRGPPQFEKNPEFSNSYLPASMQIIAYLTELMKYDLRPSTGVSTTTTVRPTPSHRPGLYSPNFPPGPQAYFARRSGYKEYLHDHLENSGYNQNEEAARSIGNNLRRFDPDLRNVDDLDLLGQGPSDLHKLVNGLEEDYVGDDEDMRLDDFFEKYDDSDAHFYLRQKKTPPTRAYVTLLSMYDLLNKETKKLGLNKFNGYSEKLLKDLKTTSTGTSAYQLKYVLKTVVDQRETRDQTLINKINALLGDLNIDDSYINVALRYLPPLAFDY